MDRLLREGNPPAGQLASPVPQYKRPGSTDYEPVEGQHGAPFATLKDASGNVVSPATEDKLEQVRVLLNTISTKDFATQTTLAAVLAKLEQLETEIQAVKANQVSGDQKVTLSGTTVEVHQETFSGTIDGSATFPNNVFDLVNTRYPTIVDRVHIKSRNVNLQINVYFGKKDGTRIQCNSLGTGTSTGTINVAPITVYHLKYSKFFQVDLFDEENGIYLLSLREPLYFPFGGLIRLTTISTESCQVGAVANYREVTS